MPYVRPHWVFNVPSTSFAWRLQAACEDSCPSCGPEGSGEEPPSPPCLCDPAAASTRVRLRRRHCGAVAAVAASPTPADLD